MNIEAEPVGIAELELYGMSMRTITLLEDRLDCIYLSDLESLTVDRVMECHDMGTRTVKEIRLALRAWLENKPVKTVQECLEFHGPGVVTATKLARKRR